MTDDDFASTFGEGFGNREALSCQNPWFMGWEDAVEMWRFSPAAEEGGEGGEEAEEEEKVEVA